MKQIIKILVADDHLMLRKGVIGILNDSQMALEIMEAPDGQEALDLCITHQPDIALLDMEMPKLNGLEVCAKLQQLKLRTKVLFLTMYKEADLFNKALDLGAWGYLIKDNTSTELINAITELNDGKKYLPDSLKNQLVSGKSNIIVNNEIAQKIATLTKTEKDILLLISKQVISKEIAAKLFISEKTVKNHRYNIIKKLELSGDQNALLKFALEYSSYLT
ncbi:MAG: response regulator transcription factor [Bacteroidota bacterium]|nr:response regulator transcription factor [Bacteroidota bacterium]